MIGRGRITASVVLLAGLALVGHPPPLASQPASLALSPANVTFVTPSVAEFEQGWVTFEGVIVEIDARGNFRWSLEIQATDPDLGGYGKPVSDLLWRTGGSGAWTPLATSGRVLASGRGSARVTVDFRVLLSWSRDRPGTYGTGLMLELQAGGGGPPGGGPPGDAPPGGRPPWAGPSAASMASAGAAGPRDVEPRAVLDCARLPLHLGATPDRPRDARDRRHGDDDEDVASGRPAACRSGGHGRQP